ncbi:MAG: hypothetical protein ACYDH3_02925 [Candidatus Aminicenantales bacterium]
MRLWKLALIVALFLFFFVLGAFASPAPSAGDRMYLEFQKVFQAAFPGPAIFVPRKMGQKFASEKGKGVI